MARAPAVSARAAGSSRSSAAPSSSPILLVFLILSCTGEGKAGTYENYMEDMRVVANGSDKIGRDLDAALTTPGVKPNQLATTLDGLADLQQQELSEAEAIKEPGALADEQAARSSRSPSASPA